VTLGSRCKNCEKMRLGSDRVNALCRRCDEELAPKIHYAVRALDDARHALDVARSDGAMAQARQDLIRQAEELLVWENKGIPTSLPTPSELLRDLRRSDASSP